MPSIDSLNAPLAYKARYEGDFPEDLVRGEQSCVVVKARSLEGMQKEAIVHNRRTGTTWRLSCDEGPYLNGTDLAPFPLAFFTAGMAISIASNIRALIEAEGASLDGVEIILDNYYTMEGSAIRGDMIGGAMPAELTVKAPEIEKATLEKIVEAAVRWSPATAYLRDKLISEFSLHRNGGLAPTGALKSTVGEIPASPEGDFDRIEQAGDTRLSAPILSKLESAEKLFDVEGGVGTSLHAEQKRILHVRGVVHINEERPYETRIQLFKPIGSIFRFIGDDPPHRGGRGRAPSGLDYLPAGVAFCYMTQIGRYAQIVKQNLRSYQIVQATVFDAPSPSLSDGAATARPVVTHVFVETEEDLEKTQELIRMGEQTCFLHAVLRSSNPVNIHV